MKAKVTVIGRLTRDVTAVFSNDDGSAKRALLTVACNGYYNGKNGEKKESVDYIPCIVWGDKRVETLIAWGKKGRHLHIDGTLETYQAGPDEDGKYPPTKIQVRIGDYEFLDKKPETQTETPNETKTETAQPQTGNNIDMNALAALVAKQMLGAVNSGETQQGGNEGLNGLI